MSQQTHYRSYWGRVFMGQMTQPTVSKVTENKISNVPTRFGIRRSGIWRTGIRRSWRTPLPPPLAQSPCNLLQVATGERSDLYADGWAWHCEAAVHRPARERASRLAARYCRRALSHDIVVMRGYRSISRYRLIDIIPSFYTSISRHERLSLLSENLSKGFSKSTKP